MTARLLVKWVPVLALLGLLVACESGGGSGDASTSSTSASTASTAAAAGSYTFDDLPNCSELVKKMEECGDKESMIKGKREGIQKDIDKGLAKDVVDNKCSIGNKAYRCSKKKGDGDKTAKSDDDDDEKDDKSAAASDGEFGIKVCDDYVNKTVGECKTFNKNTPAYKMIMERWKKLKEDGKTDDLEKACTKAAEMFKCPSK
jgi:hypothetical protein